MHLVSALGLAVVVPRLVLPGVATRPETSGSEPSQADPESDSRGHEPSPEQGQPDVAESAASGAAAPPDVGIGMASATGGSTDGPNIASDQPSSRPRRIRANPITRRARDEPGSTADLAAANGTPHFAANGSPAEHDALANGTPRSGSAEDADGAEPTARPSREDRRLARARQRQEARTTRRAKGEGEPKPLPAISYEDGQAAHVAMVRHISSLSTSLNEAHRLIGRLNMEKYQAQRDLAIAKKLPLPPPLPDPSWTRAAQAGPHAVRQLQRHKSADPEPQLDLEELAQIRAGVKRRRVIVLGAVALLVGAIALYRTTGWTWFPDISDRESMTQLAGVGAFIQIFFIGWIFFRFAKIGGKGARWLFPDVEEEHRKQRRKQRR